MPIVAEIIDTDRKFSWLGVVDGSRHSLFMGYGLMKHQVIDHKDGSAKIEVTPQSGGQPIRIELTDIGEKGGVLQIDETRMAVDELSSFRLAGVGLVCVVRGYSCDEVEKALQYLHVTAKKPLVRGLVQTLVVVKNKIIRDSTEWR